ncbi:hypothetical protein AGR7C_Lc20096 [Agrobacterium deltaense Zutra 3/1]|uniref:Uncharacterized protein n=1 Tax=Agrobacterium deltaense Zutra 3/1 TaxID=1183427 RepID=A0A1S7RLB1_9HYPH|nr:hypothetical protein AGR7C_Lc20096 [Agrobacterium deltaense Zutra 3/1]
MKERYTLLQQAIIYFTLLLRDDAVAGFAQIVTLNERGEALYNEYRGNRKSNLKDDVKAALQVNAVNDIAHDPSAERGRCSNDNHCRDCHRVPTDMLPKVLFEQSYQQLLVVLRQK